jgi:glycerone phosphate O-acyltransferase/fatty acyl-CoA reductase
LAYDIVYSMLDKIVVMPTSMVSALLLMHRRGISEDLLIKKMEWLSEQLQIRGAKTANMNVSQVDVAVRNAINLLSGIIHKTKKNIFELQVSPNLEYKNILLLSYYRNQLMHVFVHEGIVCCALNAFGH